MEEERLVKDDAFFKIMEKNILAFSLFPKNAHNCSF
jgi:hypothetical protein